MKKLNQEVTQVVDFIKELSTDNTMPRNVREKLNHINQILQSDQDINICKDKAMIELDDISNDVNLKCYTRTQIWNVVSMIEKI
jgi:uncharacterized protein (UPF0147 family)